MLKFRPLRLLTMLLLCACTGFAALAAATTEDPAHPPAGASAPLGPSDTFVVQGSPDRHTPFDAAALRALPATDLTVKDRHYRGASLWGVLQGALGTASNTVKHDGLRRYVLATGTDGYQALFSWAELDPEFGAQPVLIAYEVDGASLGRHGFARIVVPGDRKPGRWVSRLARLEVLTAH